MRDPAEAGSQKKKRRRVCDNNNNKSLFGTRLSLGVSVWSRVVLRPAVMLACWYPIVVHGLSIVFAWLYGMNLVEEVALA